MDQACVNGRTDVRGSTIVCDVLAMLADQAYQNDRSRMLGPLT